MKSNRLTDRRVQRTRALLQDALGALIIEQGYEGITVQQIIDRANVGRATFYAHFADKSALFVSRLDDLRASLLERQRQAHKARRASARGGGFTFSRAMLEHAAEALPLWKAIARAESGVFVVRRLHETLAELVGNDLVTMGMTRHSVQREMLTQCVTGAFMSVMTWWLDNGAKLTTAAVDDAFNGAIMQGVARSVRTA